jgi:hypothetical protein
VHRPKIARVHVALAAAGAALVMSLISAPTRAAAQETPKKTETKTGKKMPSFPEMQQMKPMDVMKMMDKDKKGYVTHEEFMKFYEELFKRLDRDESGTLTPPEFTDRG